MDTHQARALSQLGGDIHFFLQRCVYISQNPGPNPPVGKRPGWTDRDAYLMTVLTGGLFNIYGSCRGVLLRLGSTEGQTVHLEMKLKLSPEGTDCFEFLNQLASRHKLRCESSVWTYEFEATGKSLLAGLPPL